MISLRRFLDVVSFNGATSLILGYEFFSQGCHELLVIAISFRTFPLPHSSLTAKTFEVDNRPPLVLTSAITLSLAAPVKQPRGYRSLSRSAKAFYPAAWPNSARTTCDPPPQWRFSSATSCPR